MEEPIVDQPEIDLTKTGTDNQPIVEDIKQSEVPTDNEVKLAVQDELIISLTKERDNYKSAVLKDRGNLTEDNFVNEENLPTVEAVIDKIVSKKILDNQIVQAQQEKQKLLDAVLRENKELKVALKSKAQPVNASIGSGSESEDTSKEFFTEELKAEIFKKFPALAKNPKGLETLKANIIKNRAK